MKNFLILSTTLILLASCSSDSNPKSEDDSKEKKSDTTAVNDTTNNEPEVIPETLSEKAEMLTSLIGSYKLSNISGAMGANAMFDYEKEDENWKAFGSSISAGTREGYDIEIDEKTLTSLNNAQIIVKEDLSVQLEVNGQTYFITPFKEDGMHYSLKKEPKEFISNVPEDLTENSTFIKDNLYLYAEDEISEELINQMKIADIFADAVIIFYNKKEHQFEMYLFIGECCDTAIFTFSTL